MLVYKVTSGTDGKGPFLVLHLDKLGDLDALVNPGPPYHGEFVGEKFLVEVVDMPKEEVDNLPDFDGF